jgi:hypothetical protein
MVSISLSGGAWRTMITEPMRQIAHPSLPNVPSFSFKKYDPSTAPIKTLRAPRGVTKIAGAKAYAAKFATSPTITTDVVRIRVGGDLSEGAYMMRYQPTISGFSGM